MGEWKLNYTDDALVPWDDFAMERTIVRQVNALHQPFNYISTLIQCTAPILANEPTCSFTKIPEFLGGGVCIKFCPHSGITKSKKISEA